MSLIEFDLPGAAPIGLVDGALHGSRHLPRIHDGLPADVAGRPADGLDEGARRAQEKA